MIEFLTFATASLYRFMAIIVLLWTLCIPVYMLFDRFMTFLERILTGHKSKESSIDLNKELTKD